MRLLKIIVLLLLPLLLQGQSEGGFGFRRFANKAAMDATVVSNTCTSCSRKAYVHSTGYYYYWNGTIWVREPMEYFGYEGTTVQTDSILFGANDSSSTPLYTNRWLNFPTDTNSLILRGSRTGDDFTAFPYILIENHGASGDVFGGKITIRDSLDNGVTRELTSMSTVYGGLIYSSNELWTIADTFKWQINRLDAANVIDSTHVKSGGLRGTDINQMSATSGQGLVWDGSSWNPGYSSNVSDGDKGDIDVLSGVWTVDTGVVNNLKLASGTGGYYKGSGTIAPTVDATMSSGGLLREKFSNGVRAFEIDDENGFAAIGDVSTIGPYAFVNSSYFQSTNDSSVFTIANNLIELNTPSVDIVGPSPSLKVYEPSAGGTNSTTIKTQSQASDITLTLPPNDGNPGELLTTDGSGSLSWTTIAGAGNGIYGNSGTIFPGAVATLGSGQAFTIDYDGGNDAIKVNDAINQTIVKSKDGNGYLRLDNSGAILSYSDTAGGEFTMSDTQLKLYDYRTGANNKGLEYDTEPTGYTSLSHVTKGYVTNTFPGSTNITTLGTIATGSMSVSHLTSGTTASGLALEIPNNSTMRVNYSGGNTGWIVDDLNNAGSLFSQDGTQYLSADNTSVLIGSNNVNMEWKDGALILPHTNTAGGTTTTQTIDKISGTVNAAGAATSVTVNNNLVTTSSIVFAVIRTNDATATLKNVVPGTGSFVINFGVAPTSETSIGFFVINQ